MFKQRLDLTIFSTQNKVSTDVYTNTNTKLPNHKPLLNFTHFLWISWTVYFFTSRRSNGKNAGRPVRMLAGLPEGYLCAFERTKLEAFAGLQRTTQNTNFIRTPRRQRKLPERKPISARLTAIRQMSATATITSSRKLHALKFGRQARHDERKASVLLCLTSYAEILGLTHTNSNQTCEYDALSVATSRSSICASGTRTVLSCHSIPTRPAHESLVAGFFFEFALLFAVTVAAS